jgi:hypothetical protein
MRCLRAGRGGWKAREAWAGLSARGALIFSDKGRGRAAVGERAAKSMRSSGRVFQVVRECS